LAHGTGRQSGGFRGKRKQKKRDCFSYGRIRARARD